MAQTQSYMMRNIATLIGCYWGTEKFIVKDFQKRHPGSIRSAKVGFMATDPNNPIRNPDYRQVCSGRSGYVEVLYLELNDPTKSLEPLLRFFFQFHDPTTPDQQGNDAGPQYASVIFCDDNAQMEIARTVKTELQLLVRRGQISKYRCPTVETRILTSTPFVEAHTEHQEYLAKNPFGYCNHYLRFKSWSEFDGNSIDAKKATAQKKAGSFFSACRNMLTRKPATS